MRSPIEALIDQACGYKPGARASRLVPAAAGWDDEVARSVLNSAADSLYRYRGSQTGSALRDAAAFLYYGARQARGLRSARAFRCQLLHAARVAWGLSIEDEDAIAWISKWSDELRERQARGF